MKMVDIEVGSVWSERDWRFRFRQVRVDSVDGGYNGFAYCTVVATGRPTRIRCSTIRTRWLPVPSPVEGNPEPGSVLEGKGTT